MQGPTRPLLHWTMRHGNFIHCTRHSIGATSTSRLRLRHPGCRSCMFILWLRYIWRAWNVENTARFRELLEGMLRLWSFDQPGSDSHQTGKRMVNKRKQPSWLHCSQHRDSDRLSPFISSTIVNHWSNHHVRGQFLIKKCKIVHRELFRWLKLCGYDVTSTTVIWSGCEVDSSFVGAKYITFERMICLADNGCAHETSCEWTIHDECSRFETRTTVYHREVSRFQIGGMECFHSNNHNQSRLRWAIAMHKLAHAWPRYRRGWA